MVQDKKNHNHNEEVGEVVGKAEAFIINNQKRILIAIIAVVIIIAGFMGYKHYISEPREVNASTAIAQSEAYFAQKNYDLALNGDSINNMGFLKAIQEFNGTKAGNLAKAYAGICYAQLKKYQEAIDMLSDFEADDDMISPSTIGIMGDCYVELGQLDNAVNAFEKAAERADNDAVSPVCLMKAGLVYEKQGKFADAENVYKTIKTDYSLSMQAATIDKYIERAKLQKK